MEQGAHVGADMRAVLDYVIPIDRPIAVSTSGVEVESFGAGVVVRLDLLEQIDRLELLAFADLCAGDRNIPLGVPINLDRGALARALNRPFPM
jgi:hypothetical protein